MKKTVYDTVVIGGGHAGIEAIFALAKRNKKIALVTLDKTKIGMMPCNPAIGGSAKGIITKEIDALGGMQGYFADKATIQIKMLHENKGPAIQSIRAQIDKELYCQIVLNEIEKNKNITLIEDMVLNFHKENEIFLINLKNKNMLQAKSLIITTGVYLNSKILRGNTIKKEGPAGQKTSSSLSQNLKKLGFDLLRLKTGTPPRIFANSINYNKIHKEILTDNNLAFSWKTKQKTTTQISCFLTYTNEKTHQIIEENLAKSSMYSGLITGTGPRYCPSIEDKIARFRDKIRHQVFLEPETKKGDIIYVNGISTSLPEDIQEKFIKTISGLENCKISKYGYAIEYDCINPFNIKINLETKKISGLFFAGQINGTSGYEEAAAQGLIAGINCANFLDQKNPLIIARDKGYIGVLIDDLITKGISEPYRMLTSRAEYRLLLRNDNVLFRLAKYGKDHGLISQKDYNLILEQQAWIEEKILALKTDFISTKSQLAKIYNLKTSISKATLLTYPDVDPFLVLKTNNKLAKNVQIELKLAGYIKKQILQAKKVAKMEKLKLDPNLNYAEVKNLATEAIQKLNQIKPENIGQASRISGVNLADIQMLIFHIKKDEQGKKHESTTTR